MHYIICSDTIICGHYNVVKLNLVIMTQTRSFIRQWQVWIFCNVLVFFRGNNPDHNWVSRLNIHCQLQQHKMHFRIYYYFSFEENTTIFSTFLFFVNWQSTDLYLLQRWLQNIKGYEKRKTHGETKRSSSDDVEFGEKEVKELHPQLLREVQNKKKNYAAIKEIQQNTFDFRRKDI